MYFSPLFVSCGSIKFWAIVLIFAITHILPGSNNFFCKKKISIVIVLGCHFINSNSFGRLFQINACNKMKFSSRACYFFIFLAPNAQYKLPKFWVVGGHRVCTMQFELKKNRLPNFHYIYTHLSVQIISVQIMQKVFDILKNSEVVKKSTKSFLAL